MPKRKSGKFTRIKKRSSTTLARNRPTPTSASTSRPIRRASPPPESDGEDDLHTQPSKTITRPSQLAGHKRKRPSGPDIFDLPSSSPAPSDHEPSQPNSHDGNSQASLSASDSDRDELSRGRPFPTLKPRERFVSQAAVKKRWDHLAEPAQEKIIALFGAVERPLVALQRDERKRIEGQSVLAHVLKTLRRRLPRMPFPPGTKEWCFDYEGILKGNRLLEQQLTPALHSIALLKAEIRRERERVEEDRASLEELKKNAKDEERMLLRKVEKSHHLLEQDPDHELQDGPEDIGLVDEPLGDAALHEEELDSSLELIAESLRNHLESMEANTTQVDGISDQLLASVSNLDAELYRRLPKEKYEGLPAL